MTTSIFQEEDSKIFVKIIDAWHQYFCMFHGSVIETNKNFEPEDFQALLEDFTNNFKKYFFSKEYVKNLMWNLCFKGFFYCPIDRKTFLQAQYLQNGIFMEFEDQVKHICLFHDEFFISSSMDNKSAQTLYSYLVGCNEAQREDRQMKCFSFKDVSKNVRTVVKDEPI